MHILPIVFASSENIVLEFRCRTYRLYYLGRHPGNRCIFRNLSFIYRYASSRDGCDDENVAAYTRFLSSGTIVRTSIISEHVEKSMIGLDR